jgi:hypothetical protein
MKTRHWRNWLAMICVAILSLIISSVPTFLGHGPIPSIHDEFAYLLQADTFAHGRLTNPPHPMWQHFETFHVIQQPTYAAKFPPGQGIAMAIGEKLGDPIFGAWLSVAIGCAAIVWMLLAFVPARWATIGGIWAATAPVTFHWAQSYWGGGVAMIGGALLGGAALRIVRRQTISLGIVAGIGLAILANSRPFEGLLVSILVAILLGRRMFTRKFLTRIVPGAAIILLPTFLGMLYYNWRVTGNPLELPYSLYAKQYMTAPLMFWQKPNPQPIYRYEVMQRFHFEEEYLLYLKQTSFAGFVNEARDKIATWCEAYVDPRTMAIPLLGGLAFFFKKRVAKWCVIVCVGLPLVHMCCTPWMRIQYLAPAMGFFIALATVGIVQIAKARAGLAMIALLITAQIILAAVSDVNFINSPKSPYALLRASLLDELQRNKGVKYLIIVHYQNWHPPTGEMVYNGADIGGSQIIFARDMDELRNRELTNYFHDRRIILLDADSGMMRVAS